MKLRSGTVRAVSDAKPKDLTQPGVDLVPLSSATAPSISAAVPSKVSTLLSFTKLTIEQANRLRLAGALRVTPRNTSPLSKSLLNIASHLLSVQAQDPEAALLAFWNRLPAPRPTRAVIYPLVLLGSDKAGLARIWAQRCTLQLISGEDWRLLAACCAERVRQCKEAELHRTGENAVSVLAQLERQTKERLEEGRHVTSVDVDAWVDDALAETPNMTDAKQARLVLRYTLPVLTTLAGVGERIVGDDARRVCLITRGRSVQWGDMDEMSGLCKAAERYFRAYAPATEADFRYWMGIKAGPSRAAVQELLGKGSLLQVEVEGKAMMLVAAERAAEFEDAANGKMRHNPMGRVMLLGRFDAVLLGHKDKSWIVDERFRRRIWSNHSEVASCVLVDGRILGKWKRMGNGVRIVFFEGVEVEGVLADVFEAGRRFVVEYREKNGDVVVEIERGGGTVRLLEEKDRENERHCEPRHKRRRRK